MLLQSYMPSKFVVRDFRDNACYHLYNRSINGENIFLDTQDFRVFLFYIYIYTTPSEQVSKRFSDLPKRLREKTLVSQLNVLAYNQMSDHFHLIVYQLRSDAIPKLMKQVANGYTVYFNQKYHHRGPVFSGRYKAVEVSQNDGLTDLTRYLHLEPVKRGVVPSPQDYEWSSYAAYIGKESFINCNINQVMSKIGNQEKFISFHEDKIDYKRRQDKLRPLLIESPELL